MSGHANALDDIDPGALNIRAVVHGEGVVPGQPYPLRLRLSDVSGLPRGVRVTSISPRDLPLDLEPIVRKTVQVRAEYTHMDQLPKDYKITGASFQHPTVILTGAAKDLESLTEISTNPIPLDRYIHGDFNYDCTLNIQPGIRANISKMQVRVKVDKAFVSEKRTIQIEISQSAEHTQKFKVVKQDPKSVVVEVKGTHSALEKLRNSDIAASISLKTVDKPGVYSLPIGITINNSHDITFEDPNIKAQVTVEQE